VFAIKKFPGMSHYEIGSPHGEPPEHGLSSSDFETKTGGLAINITQSHVADGI